MKIRKILKTLLVILLILTNVGVVRADDTNTTDISIPNSSDTTSVLKEDDFTDEENSTQTQQVFTEDNVFRDDTNEYNIENEEQTRFHYIVENYNYQEILYAASTGDKDAELIVKLNYLKDLLTPEEYKDYLRLKREYFPTKEIFEDNVEIEEQATSFRSMNEPFDFTAAATQYSDWSTTPSGKPGEQEKTQYSKREVIGYEFSSTPKNNDSKLVKIYYVDIEYVVLDNYKWLPSTVQKEESGRTLKVFTLTNQQVQPTAHNWTTVDKTIYQNKWKFKTDYDSQEVTSGDRMDIPFPNHDFNTRAHSMGYYQSASEIYSSFANIGSKTPDPSKNQLATAFIGFGVQADSPWGYRIDLDDFGEFNEYNLKADQQFNGTGNNWWSPCELTGTPSTSMCYEYRVGEKTTMQYDFFFTEIQDVDGTKKQVPGTIGNYRIGIRSRKSAYDGNGSPNYADAKKISLIERTYYVDYSNSATKNVISQTYVTPKWGNWSNWQDDKINASNSVQVRTRKLYRYPLGYYLKFDSNGGVGTFNDIYKQAGIDATIPTSYKPTRTSYRFLGWGENKTTPVYQPGGKFTKDLTADKTLYAIWQPLGTAQIRFIDSVNSTTLKTRNKVEGDADTVIKDAGYKDDLNSYLNQGYVLVQDGMSANPKYEFNKNKIIEVKLKKLSIVTEVVNGTIDPSIQNISKGDNKTIKYSGNDGYLLSEVRVDKGNNIAQQNPNDYTFSNIQDDHSIKVIYEKQNSPVKTVKDENGEAIGNKIIANNTIIMYEIKVENPTAVDLEYTVNDNLPQGTEFISADNNGAENNGTVTWRITIPAKQSITLKLLAQGKEYGKALQNKATISVTDFGGKTITLDSNTEEVWTSEPAIKVAKSEYGDANEKILSPGDTLNYEISFKNPSDLVKQFTITDKYPEGLQFISASDNGVEANGVITWNINLEAKQEKTVNASFKILESAAGDVLKNMATIIVDNSNEDTNEVVTPVIPEPKKAVYLNDENVDKMFVNINDELTYTITVENPSEQDKQFVITDKVSEHLDNIKDISNDGKFNDDRTLSWQVNIPARQELTLSYKATVKDFNAYIFNQADILVDDINIKTNKIENWTPSENVDKKVESIDGENIEGLYQLSGTEIVYKITATNISSLTKEFTIEDHLPEGVKFISADNNGIYADGVVTWKLNLQPEEIKIVKVNVLIEDEAKDSVLINIAKQYVDKSNIESKEIKTPVLDDPIKTVKNDKGEDIDGLNVSNDMLLVYELSVHNCADEQKEFVLQDSIPDFTELASNPDEGEVDENGLITWNKTLEPDETWSVVFIVKTTKFDVYIENKALIKVDKITKNTNITENWIPIEPVKTVTNEKGEDAHWDQVIAQDNRRVVYDIYFSNPSDHDAQVVITDKLHDALKLVEVSDDGVYDEETRIITWDLTVPAHTTKQKVSVEAEFIPEFAQTEVDNKANILTEEFNHDTNIVKNYLIDDPTTIDLEGIKKWEDNDNALGIRPSHIVVELYANGELYRNQKVRGDNSEWSYKFSYLPKFMKGHEVKYEIKEQEVNNYISLVDGMNITNKYMPNSLKEVFNEKGEDVADDYVSVGDILTYKITFDNVFNEEKVFNIEDIIPRGLKFIEASDNGVHESNKVKWTLNVAANSQKYVTVKLEVTEEAKVIIKNTAKVKVGDYIFDTNEVEVIKGEKGKGVILVEYKDKETGEILTTESFEVEIGATYRVNKNSINGYDIEWDKTSAPETGVGEKGVKTVVYLCSKNGTMSDDQDKNKPNNNTPDNGQNTNKTNTSNNATPRPVTQNIKVTNTGLNGYTLIPLCLIASVALFTILIILRKRKEY